MRWGRSDDTILLSTVKVDLVVYIRLRSKLRIEGRKAPERLHNIDIVKK